MKRNLLFMTVATLLAIAPAVRADQAESSTSQAPIPIKKFSEVSPGIYRGARPGAEGLKALHDVLEIKTDIDLDNDAKANAAEASAAKTLSIDFFNESLSGFWEPKDQKVDQIIALMADKSNYPLFVHCLHGEDRTGMIVGVYRVMVEGVKPADAIKEALEHGFHEDLLPLNYYFREKTEKEYEALHGHPPVPTPDEGSAFQMNL